MCLKRKTINLTREAKKEVVLLHRYNPIGHNNNPPMSFYPKYVGEDLKRNYVSQILKGFVNIVQSNDDLKAIKRTKEAMYPKLESTV